LRLNDYVTVDKAALHNSQDIQHQSYYIRLTQLKDLVA